MTGGIRSQDFCHKMLVVDEHRHLRMVVYFAIYGSLIAVTADRRTALADPIA